MYDSISSCTVNIPVVKPVGSHLRIDVILKGTSRSTRAAAMIDSGATGLFLSKRFVKKHRVTTHPLTRAIPLLNIDGSDNTNGAVTHFARLNLKAGDYSEELDFLVTDIGPEEVILGLPWLKRVNPKIDFKEGSMNLDSEEVPEEAAPPVQEEEPFQKISACRALRRRWVKQGILEAASDELWIAAGYTHSTRLAAEANQGKPKKSFEEMVPEEYRKYSKVFSEQESERLPDHKPTDHPIDLKPDAPETIRSKVYPMPVNEQEALKEFIEENLRKGYIQPSKSPMASPVFFIKKKDGKLRLIQDYRKLNDITIKNRYPLPLASDIINRLRNAKYFTKFDVRWGYNNVRIREGDEWKAAFVTDQGLYEPKVMFFGLTNAPATFQALMNSIFADLIAQGKVAVYLDDILIFSETLEEHRKVTHEVLRRLQENDLYLRPEKCEFEKTEIEYLGLVIRQGQVSMDPVKVQAVKEWSTPRNLTEVRGFLGFANFYRRFIQDFAKLARPLNDLTKKDTKWNWGDDQQLAFDTLKEKFISDPILVMWNQSRPTRIEVDASGFATGGVILQKCDDDLWHPVAYRSESMSEAERNYEIYDREMLAIIRALEDWRHFLEGLPFEIISDHKNLEYWRTAKDLTRRQARWALWLSRFDFILTHKPGKTNTQADPLSRMSSHAVSDADDNVGQIVLKPERFARLAATHVFTSPLEERIRECSERESEVVKNLETLAKMGPRKLANGLLDWEEVDGLVYHQGRLYVPNNTELRAEVIKTCHDALTAGHPGKHGTWELALRHYWWPGMGRMVQKYVEGCEQCARRKPAYHPKASLRPHDVPEGPWQVVGVDLITGLPRSKGYDAIATYVDLYSKQVHIIPTTSDVDANGIIDIHYREIFRLHGIPKKFVSDRGPQFAATLMRVLYQKLGIQAGLTTAYHPEGNGQTERMNQEIEQYLRLFVDKRQEDWADLLPTAEFALNSRLHSAHQQTPFEVIYGYRPDFTLPAGRPSPLPALDERLRILREARKEAEAALRMDKARHQERYETDKNQAHEFQVGDKVWLSAKNINVHQPTKKLGVRQLGPYEVTARVGDLAYRLKLPPSLKIHDVFNVDLLSPWKGNEVNGIEPPEPEPVEVDGEEEWEVEKVLDSRRKYNPKTKKQELQYEVKWKGFSQVHNTWEWASNLENAPEKVKAFHRRHASAPQKISATVFATLPWQSYENLTESPNVSSKWEEGARILHRGR